MKDSDPWNLPRLIGHMLSDGWQPRTDGTWSHADGARVDLLAQMLDKRPYWTQLTERRATPPTSPVPF
jgi:hypothetical protein